MDSDDQPTWLLAQGEVDGKPIMIRAREPHQIRIDPARKHVVVASLAYAARDTDQLPSDEDYEALEAFEAQAFEAPSGDPELVFVETEAGVVRYFAYTSDVERTVASISQTAASFQTLDWDSAEDPEWQIYFRRIDRLRGT